MVGNKEALVSLVSYMGRAGAMREAGSSEPLETRESHPAAREIFELSVIIPTCVSKELMVTLKARRSASN
jgi:hypothetical protein